ncbi:MAG TPA: SBBP repeat-containing protein [Terriglobales bacterium]|nr:SBBP repeat-containing protein [Terriglobales bacterium]
MTPNQPRLRLCLSPKLACAVAVIAALVIGVQKYSNHNDSRTPIATHPSTPPRDVMENRRRVLTEYGKLPLAFEPNLGQTDPEVKYMARGNGYVLFLTARDAVVSFSKPGSHGRPAVSVALRMGLADAGTTKNIMASDPQAGVSNYYLGKDPSKWRTNVPQFGRVNYEGAYPGVDLAFHGAQRQVEFDFVVKPHADASQIALQFSGSRRLRTDQNGDLILFSDAGEVRLHRPVAYQESASGRRAVDARFVLAGGKVRFALGPYDKSQELVIDPTVSYATYIGGTGEDQATSVAVDSSGNAYITGEAGDATFPHSAGTFAGGGHDAYVFKLNASGTAQLYSTLFGGSGDESGNGIAIDSSGNAYVTGGTGSADFPVTAGVFQSTLNGPLNAFVAKLNSSGAISYATYLGGSSNDAGVGITIDSSFNTYVTGEADSSDFPTLNAFQSVFGGNADAFVTELNPTATALVYSTYLGGSGVDNATGIALSGGKVYITGNTIPSGATAFPTTAGVFQTTAGGGTDAFVCKVDTTQTGNASLSYSTLLGGSGDENAYAIAVDGSGNAHVTGSTTSGDFPTASASQGSLSGTQDAFVTKFDATASSLSFSTYLGGTNSEIGVGIALDGSNNIYVTGQTGSTDFPTVNPTQAATGGGANDAFVSEFVGSTMTFSTYLGGSGQEDVTSTGVSGAIVVDASNNIYVVGDTSSADFPASSGAFQTAFGGGVADAFVAKFAPSAGTPDFSVSATALSPASVTAGTSATSTVTVTGLFGFSGTVALSCSNITPTGPTCSFNPTSVAGSGISTLTVSTTGVAAGSYTFTVTGTSGALAHSTTVTLTVTAGADFTLSATALSPASITAGSSASSTVTIAATGGFAGPVALSCSSITPTVSSPPSCSFNPGSVNGSGTSTLTVSTTSSTPRAGLRQSLPFYVAWLPVCGVALLGTWRKKAFTILLGVLALSGLLLLAACGSSGSGGGGGGGGGGNGTTYTITVTGTSGSLSHSQALTLTVK